MSKPKNQEENQDPTVREEQGSNKPLSLSASIPISSQWSKQLETSLSPLVGISGSINLSTAISLLAKEFRISTEDLIGLPSPLSLSAVASQLARAIVMDSAPFNNLSDSIKRLSAFSQFGKNPSISMVPLGGISGDLAKMLRALKHNSEVNVAPLLERAEQVNGNIPAQLEELEQTLEQGAAWMPQVAKKIGKLGWTIHSNSFITKNPKLTLYLINELMDKDSADINEFFLENYSAIEDELFCSIRESLDSMLGVSHFIPIVETAMEQYQLNHYAQALILIFPVVEGLFVHYYAGSLEQTPNPKYVSPQKPELLTYGNGLVEDSSHLQKLILMTVLECYNTLWARGKNNSQLNRNVILHGCSAYCYDQMDVLKLFVLLATMLDSSMLFVRNQD